MGGLDHEGLGGFHHQIAQRCAAAHRLDEGCGRHAPSIAADLQIGRMLGAVVAHHQRDSGHAFPADHAHFDAMVFFIHRYHRDHAGLHEIDVGDGLVRHLHHLAFFQRDHFQMGSDQRPVVGRQFGQQAVANIRAR